MLSVSGFWERGKGRGWSKRGWGGWDGGGKGGSDPE